MSDINYTNRTVRRDDWKHTAGSIAAAPPRAARRMALSGVKEKPVDFHYVPAVKPEVHPLKMPATMEPARVDWKAGREYYDRKNGNVRIASQADIPELMSWGFDKIKLRYPRATPAAIASYLNAICHNKQARFLRTDTACGLFEYVQSAWEPLPIVIERFIAPREPQMAALDVRRIYSAAMAWAEEVNAVEFVYGGSTEVDITPMARKIGYDHRSYLFIRRLSPHDNGA